jgi:hypothetical protein
MTDKKSQLEKFKQTARDLECDESEEAFERKLKKVAKEKPADKSAS